MNRITTVFRKLREEDKKGFIPFITAGDPDLNTTLELLIELADSGATLIELGIPFTDPMADGPVIQRASERALKHRFGIEDILELVLRARERTDTPIILFTYFNPILQFGLDRLATEAKRVGIDGVLVTDLTPEESTHFASILRANELEIVFLVAPTTTDDRLQLIAKGAGGFIYVVSRPGVTGVRADVSLAAEQLVKRVRGCSELPVAVGFGISTAAQVAETWRYADAVVVGSAIVAEIERTAGAANFVQQIGAFARRLLPQANREL